MTTPPALATRPPSLLDPASRDEELSLAALLELFSPAETEGFPAWRSLRTSGTRLRTLVQHSSHRAAAWGAVSAVATSAVPARTAGGR